MARAGPLWPALAPAGSWRSWPSPRLSPFSRPSRGHDALDRQSGCTQGLSPPKEIPATLAPGGPAPPAPGLPAGQAPGRDMAVLGGCSGGRGAGAVAGEWGGALTPASHQFLMLFSTLTPTMKSFQVWPLDLLSLKPGTGPGICIVHTPRGVWHPCPGATEGLGAAASTGARGSSRPVWGLRTLSPQLRQWRLRWVWRTWRRRVVQLRVAWRLQQRAEGWVLSQVLAGRPQPPAGPSKPSTSELQALPACHPWAPSFAGAGQCG